MHVTGTVRDTDGAPLAGAVVTLRAGADPRAPLVRTDSAGRFAITRFGDPEPPIRVRVCLAGYALQQREFRSAAALPESLAFVLRRRAEEAQRCP